MKTVKIVIASLLLTASFSATSIAQDAKKEDTKTAKSAPQLKEHKCNAQCNAAAHNYLHGEKGHVCTAACKKATKKA